jgi:hypothetical protein
MGSNAPTQEECVDAAIRLVLDRAWVRYTGLLNRIEIRGEQYVQLHWLMFRSERDGDTLTVRCSRHRRVKRVGGPLVAD